MTAWHLDMGAVYKMSIALVHLNLVCDIKLDYPVTFDKHKNKFSSAF